MKKKPTQEEIDEQVKALNDLIMSNQLADGPPPYPRRERAFDYVRHVWNKFVAGW